MMPRQTAFGVLWRATRSHCYAEVSAKNMDTTVIQDILRIGYEHQRSEQFSLPCPCTVHRRRLHLAVDKTAWLRQCMRILEASGRQRAGSLNTSMRMLRCSEGRASRTMKEGGVELASGSTA